jgi:hypothetical protein
VTRGYGEGNFVSLRSENARFDGTALLSFTASGAGSACISMRGSAVGALQEVSGSFTILGGTGAGGRLHATGTFAAVQRQPYSNGFVAEFYMRASFGSRRARRAAAESRRPCARAT